MRVDATLTRTGVFKYRNPDGSERLEYRPREEVNAPESLASFEAVPVTDDHPPVMVTAKNARQYTCGTTLPGIHMDAEHMIGELVVFDEALIRKMDGGKVQISNGYTCDLEMSPGVTPEGEPYHAIQRNIRGNHVAVVDAGRAGSARARMDVDDFADEVDATLVPSTCTVADPVHTHAEHGDAILMPTPEELTKERDAEKARADKATADAAAEKARADKLEGERDAEKARADAAEKARADAAAAGEQALADAREQGRKDAIETLDVQGKARAILGDEYKADADVAALKLAVVMKVDSVDCTGKAPAYLDARFDSAVERFANGAAAVATLRTVLVNPTNPATPAARVDEREATRKMQDAYAAAWKES